VKSKCGGRSQNAKSLSGSHINEIFNQGITFRGSDGDTRIIFGRILIPCQHWFLPFLDGYLIFKKKKPWSQFLKVFPHQRTVLLSTFFEGRKKRNQRMMGFMKSLLKNQWLSMWLFKIFNFFETVV
jgi:hypothetical protein